MLALITRFLSLATLPKIWKVVKVSIQSTGLEEDGRNQLKQNLMLFRKLMVLIQWDSALRAPFKTTEFTIPDVRIIVECNDEIAN